MAPETKGSVAACPTMTISPSDAATNASVAAQRTVVLAAPTPLRQRPLTASASEGAMPRTVHQGEANKPTPQSSGSLQRTHLTEMMSQLDRNYEIATKMCSMYREGLAVIQELRAAREAIDERCRGAELRAEQLEHRLKDLMPALGLASAGKDGVTASELSAFWCQVASSMDEKALSINLKGSRWEMPQNLTQELPTLPLQVLPPQLSLTQQAPQALLPTPARVLCHPDQPPQVHLTRPESLHAGHQPQQPHQLQQQQLQQGEQLRQPQQPQPPQRTRSFLSEGRDAARTGAQVHSATPTVKKRTSHEQLQPERMGRAERAGRTAHREATSPEFSPGSVSRRIAELEERAASAIRSRGRDGCSSPKCRSPNHSPSGLHRSPSGCVRSPVGGFRSLRDGNGGPRKEADQVPHAPSWSHLHGGGATGSSSDYRWNSTSHRPHAVPGAASRSGTPQSGRARGTQHHDRQLHGVRAHSSAPQPRGSVQCGNWPRGRVPQSSSSASSLSTKATQSSNSVIRERIKALQAKGLTAAAAGPRRWSPRDAILGCHGDPDEPGRG